jgi:hypothetical protein
MPFFPALGESGMAVPDEDGCGDRMAGIDPR